MHIVCPHCTTSFAINPAALGAAGRTVRCSRCKEVWLARPEDAVEAVALAPAMAAAAPASARRDVVTEWDAMAQEDDQAPVVESPSVSPDWPAAAAQHEAEADWTTAARHDIQDDEDEQPRRSRLRTLFALPQFPMLRGAGLTATCGAMAALALALIFLRNDVVRLLPQTASFYSLVGLDV